MRSRKASACGRVLIDLITANPHDYGFVFNPDLFAEIISKAAVAAGRYAPDAQGVPAAREAIAQVHGLGISLDQVILTPGTSLAYFYAFRLFADPGDDILCPAPTYPLFDDLARLAGLNIRRYHLNREYRDGSVRYTIDPDEIAFQITPRTRMMAVVSPHNPTGTIVSQSEWHELAPIINERKITVAFDEVFRDFTLSPEAEVSRPAEGGIARSVCLNGLSKMLSLPGLKAGWMTVEGEQEFIQPSLNALEYLSDMFLPVSDISQQAIPELLGQSGLAENHRLMERYRTALKSVLDICREGHQTVNQPESGPYLCFPLDTKFLGREEAVALLLLQKYGVLVHPGSLYQFSEPTLVTTCVNQAGFAAAAQLLSLDPASPRLLPGSH